MQCKGVVYCHEDSSKAQEGRLAPQSLYLGSRRELVVWTSSKSYNFLSAVKFTACGFFSSLQWISDGIAGYSDTLEGGRRKKAPNQEGKKLLKGRQAGRKGSLACFFNTRTIEAGWRKKSRGHLPTDE